jgi:hypothetical protein
MDYYAAVALFQSEDSASIQSHLLSDGRSDRQAVARELKALAKLKGRITELGFLIEILVPASESEDPEVREAVARCLARFATEAWTDYERHCQAQGMEARLREWAAMKHQGIRKAAIQALVATAVHRASPESLEALWNHPSPKLRATVIRALQPCLVEGLSVGLFVPQVFALLPGAHKLVARAVVALIETWLEHVPPSRAHFRTLESMQEAFASMEDPKAKELATAIGSHLATHACADEIDALFSKLESAQEAERRDAIAKMFPLFDRGAVQPEEVSGQIDRALVHPDPGVREGISRLVSNADWRRGQPVRLLEHEDEAVRRGAETVLAVRNAVVDALSRASRSTNPVPPRKASAAPSRAVKEEPDEQPGVDSRVRRLLLELFDQEMRQEWGWGQSFEPGWRTRPGPLTRDVVGRVYCGSLRVFCYHSSSVTIDWHHRRVRCFAVDQKTPADTEWNLVPSEDWWERAKACPIWPVGERV